MATINASGYNNGTYSFEQQIFCISWATVLSFGFRGGASEIASQTKALLINVLQDEEIQKLIGVWNLAWGPGIFSAPIVSEKADNTMFIVAPEADPTQAVVAIAGTSGLVDWVFENFNVKETVPWPYGHSSTNPQISKGINFGLDKLTDMESFDSTTSFSITAQQYLASQSFTKVMVTGHSLGGALSPCYALYLDETRSQWDSIGSAIISCLPTAGQTPGDINFSQYYDSKLLATTTKIWNLLDIVPHAFNTERLGEIPDLYEPDLSSTDGIKSLVCQLQQVTESLNYLNVAPDAEGFPSQVVDLADFTDKYKPIVEAIEETIETLRQAGTAFGDNESNGNVEEFIKFIIQALIQHTAVYTNKFDVGDFLDIMLQYQKKKISPQRLTLLSKPVEGDTRLSKIFSQLST
ncbi:lipase [Leptothoe sp. LEGE 181152]|nr:lipase [Leptothoe sp. LEGE 181152]